jgi:hypothetical protein
MNNLLANYTHVNIIMIDIIYDISYGNPLYVIEVIKKAIEIRNDEIGSEKYENETIEINLEKFHVDDSNDNNINDINNNNNYNDDTNCDDHHDKNYDNNISPDNDNNFDKNNDNRNNSIIKNVDSNKNRFNFEDHLKWIKLFQKISTTGLRPERIEVCVYI